MQEPKRKKYDAQFKRQSVELAESSGKTDRAIEKDLGLYQGSIRHWRTELAADPKAAFPGTGRLKPADDEMRRLRKENDILRKERDILKKAMAIFSRPRKADTGS